MSSLSWKKGGQRTEEEQKRVVSSKTQEEEEEEEEGEEEFLLQSEDRTKGASPPYSQISQRDGKGAHLGHKSNTVSDGHQGYSDGDQRENANDVFFNLEGWMEGVSCPQPSLTSRRFGKRKLIDRYQRGEMQLNTEDVSHVVVGKRKRECELKERVAERKRECELKERVAERKRCELKERVAERKREPRCIGVITIEDTSKGRKRRQSSSLLPSPSSTSSSRSTSSSASISTPVAMSASKTSSSHSIHKHSFSSSSSLVSRSPDYEWVEGSALTYSRKKR